MRKNVGSVMLGLSGFLLLIGLMALVWAPGQVERTPIDVDSVTYYEGEVSSILTDGETVPAKVVTKTRSDSESSSDDVAIFMSSTCLMVNRDDPPDCVDETDDRLLNIGTDNFATDRVSALSVESSALPADAVPHEGLVNKFPFNAEKKTYLFWDGVLGAGVDAEYDRTDDVQGLEAYVYRIEVEGQPIEVNDLAATYDDVKEVFVDPRTGTILNVRDDQQRTLEDGTVALDLSIEFSEEEQLATVNDTEENISSLNLLLAIVPLIGFVVGGLLLVVGLLLVLRAPRSPDGPSHSESRDPVSV